jgi:hypothetical protein
MGGLSRKRKIPRVVKKTRNQKQKKGLNIHQLPEGLRKNWKPDMSIADNFANLGLRYDTQKRMVQSKAGHALIEQATKDLHSSHYQF